jgi:hypothetical protein
MHVEPDSKFAAFFLSRCSVKADLPQEVEIQPGVWISQQFGIEIAEHSRNWLGSLATDEMKEGGLAVYVTGPSKQPEVLDEENQALHQEVEDILNGLLVQGVPEFMKGFVVNGANVNGQIGIRQQSSFRELFTTFDHPDFLVGLVEIRRAVWLGRRLRYIQEAPRPEWGRLIRGLKTLLLANRLQNQSGDRLHQFVRALEAVITPRIGESKSDFAHRGQTLAVANAQTREVLIELYDLRSAVEHLNVPQNALQADTEAERLAVVNRRTRQADTLARASLLRVLESSVMFNIFRRDAEIEDFWRLREHARSLLWGERLDILAIQ